ncbi:MAG: glycosyltransferase family 2 protein [Bacteroidetes bacterium]|nr:glycosyltransferase family 2 protein [Bacteroidota bacterium]
MISEKKILVLIPAHNEEKRVADVIKGVRRFLPAAKILVINDGSKDETVRVSNEAGALVISHPFNLGVGTALQTGYKYAVQNGYKYVIQLDGDGQHPPEFLPAFVSKLNETDADFIIGSRFLNGNESDISILRNAGNMIFGKIVSFLIREKLTDPTSGYRAFKSTTLLFCVQDVYAFDYPDADFLLTLHRSGFRMIEIPIKVLPRTGGKSQHDGLKPVYYTIKMFLSIFITMLRRKRINKTT